MPTRSMSLFPCPHHLKVLKESLQRTYASFRLYKAATRRSEALRRLRPFPLLRLLSGTSSLTERSFREDMPLWRNFIALDTMLTSISEDGTTRKCTGASHCLDGLSMEGSEVPAIGKSSGPVTPAKRTG